MSIDIRPQNVVKVETTVATERRLDGRSYRSELSSFMTQPSRGSFIQ